MDALPKIKCSDCHAEVELVALGDHVCSKVAGPTVTTSPVEEKLSVVSEFNEHGPPPKRSLSRESLFNRLGRVQPPPNIDPTAASTYISPLSLLEVASDLTVHADNSRSTISNAWCPDVSSQRKRWSTLSTVCLTAFPPPAAAAKPYQPCSLAIFSCCGCA